MASKGVRQCSQLPDLPSKFQATFQNLLERQHFGFCPNLGLDVFRADLVISVEGFLFEHLAFSAIRKLATLRPMVSQLILLIQLQLESLVLATAFAFPHLAGEINVPQVSNVYKAI